MCYVHLENTCYGPGAPPSTPPSPHTPDTFRKFKRLPVELRCMIWSLAPDPRVVEVVYCKKYKNWFCPRESHHPPSGLLLANKESHQEYLWKWKRCIHLAASQRSVTDFPTRCSHHIGSYHIFGVPYTYFNPEIDTLYISQFREPCYNWMTPFQLLSLRVMMPYLDNMRYLCVEVNIKYDDNSTDFVKIPDSAWSTLRPSPQTFFPGLERFMIIIRDYFEDSMGYPAHGIVVDAYRPRGVIELREASEALLNTHTVANVSGYYKRFAQQHAQRRNPPWVIKNISRGGRRGLQGWIIMGNQVVRPPAPGQT